MTSDSPADVRVAWELNRFHHAVALGLTWQLTHDDRYPTTFVSQASDWLTANPVGHGVNWACAIEFAIRATNWLFACALMQEPLPADFVRALAEEQPTMKHFPNSMRTAIELAISEKP